MLAAIANCSLITEGFLRSRSYGSCRLASTFASLAQLKILQARRRLLYLNRTRMHSDDEETKDSLEVQLGQKSKIHRRPGVRLHFSPTTPRFYTQVRLNAAPHTSWIFDFNGIFVCFSLTLYCEETLLIISKQRYSIDYDNK